MKKLTTLIFLFIFTITFSKNLEFYNLEGVKINKEKEAITISYFEKKYFPEYKFINSHSVYENFYNKNTETGILAIYFQEFTNKPLYVLGNQPTKKQIQEALKTFDYNKYLKSSSFTYNLKKYTSEGNLLIEDLYKIFGKPNKETSTSEYTFFDYTYPSLNFTIKNGVVIDFIYIKPD